MKKIDSLTFLRFIAALIVVIFHYGRDSKLILFAKPFITSGPQMVSLFYVLSGFVMLVSHINKKNDNLRNYYVARVARIVPVYLIALLISIYFDFGRGINNSKALLLNFTFLQSWFSPYPLSFNSPAWSLSVEAFFYLIFPLIIFFIKNSGISWKKLSVISLLIYFFTQAILSSLLNAKLITTIPSAAHDLINYFPLSHFCSFLLGVAAGFLYVNNKDKFNNTGFVASIILVGCIIFNIAMLQYRGLLGKFFPFPLAASSSFFSLPFTFLILSVVYSKNILTKVMAIPLFVILGEASYSLYILQKPVYLLYNKFLAKLLTNTFQFNKDSSFYAYLIILIIISVVSFYLIELPGKKVIQNFNLYLLSRKQHLVE
jgi:peptidoglycan/LPS O-acetylase OafA/YrhL